MQMVVIKGFGKTQEIAIEAMRESYCSWQKGNQNCRIPYCPHLYPLEVHGNTGPYVARMVVFFFLPS